MGLDVLVIPSLGIERTRHTGGFRRHEKTGDGVDKAENEVSNGEPSDPDHGLAEGWLYYTVAHADDQEQEE